VVVGLVAFLVVRLVWLGVIMAVVPVVVALQLVLAVLELAV
jgi:hypothetical protein